MTVGFQYPLQPSATIGTAGVGTIAQGTLSVDIYAGDIASGSSYILSDNAFYAEKGFTDFEANNSVNLTFDLDVKKTLIIHGKAICNVPIIIQNNTGSQQGYTSSWALTISKVDANSNATVLVNQEHSDNILGIGATTGTAWRIYAFNPDIPRTVFRLGEKYRVNFKGMPITFGHTYVLHDPKNRVVFTQGVGSSLPGLTSPQTVVTSQLIIKTPFVTE